MKTKTKENLNALFYFTLLFALTYGSVIYNFRIASTWQIVVGSFFIVAFVAFLVLTVIEIVKSKTATDSQFISIICCHLMMFWIILLNQFGGEIAVNIKFRVILAASILSYFIYQLIHWGRYLKILFRDKALRIFTTVAVFVTVFGLVYFALAQISIMLKIGLGVDFVLLVYAIINIIFYNDTKYFKPEDRNTFIYKLVTIMLYAIAIFLFPYYLKWCGLDEESFSIFIPVYSYVVGGMLTLGGVAWTIRKSENDKREDDVKRSKPVVFIYDQSTLDELGEKPTLKVLLSHQNKGTLEQAISKERAYTLSQFVIGNSDYSYISVIGFKINDDFHLYDMIQILPKNTTYKLVSNFRFRFEDEIEHVSILLQDMLDNVYELGANFKIDEGRLDVVIDVLSGLETKMIILPKVPAKNKKE